MLSPTYSFQAKLVLGICMAGGWGQSTAAFSYDLPGVIYLEMQLEEGGDDNEEPQWRERCGGPGSGVAGISVCAPMGTSKRCSERCLGWGCRSRSDGCSGALGSRFLVPKPLEEKAAGLCVPISECSQSICHQIQGLV